MHTASFRIAHQREYVTPSQKESQHFDTRCTELMNSIHDAHGNSSQLDRLHKDVKQLNQSLSRGLRKNVATRINALYTQIAQARPRRQAHRGGVAGRRCDPKDRQQAVAKKRALKEAARAPQSWQSDPNNDTIVIPQGSGSAAQHCQTGLTKAERAHLDRLAQSHDRCSAWIEQMSWRIEDYIEDVQSVHGEDDLFKADGSWPASLYLAVEARFVQDDETSRADFRAELRQEHQVYQDFLAEISSDSGRQLRRDAKLVLNMLHSLERLPKTQRDDDPEELDLDELYAEREAWVEGMRSFLDAIPQVKLAAGRWSSSLYWQVEKRLLQDVAMKPDAFRADLKWQMEQLEELFERLEPEATASLRARAEPLIEMHGALSRLPQIPFTTKV